MGFGKTKNKAKNLKKPPLTESNKVQQSKKTKKIKNDAKANKGAKTLKKTKDGSVKKAKLKENVKIPVTKEKIKKIVAKENKIAVKNPKLIKKITMNKKATENVTTPKTGEGKTPTAEKIVKKTPKTEQTVKKTNKAKTTKTEVAVKVIKKGNGDDEMASDVKESPQKKAKKKPIKSKVNVSPEKESKFRCVYCAEVPKRPSRSELYRHYAIKHHKNDLIQHLEATYGPIAKGKDLPCPVCEPQVVKGNRTALIDHMALKHNLIEQFLPESAKIV